MSTIKALLITESIHIAKSQIYPFHKYKNELKEKFNFNFKVKVVDGIRKKEEIIKKYLKKDIYNIIFIQTWFDIDRKEIFDFFKEISHTKNKTKIVYLDWFAPLHLPYPEILSFIDLYIKKQYLKNLNQYSDNDFIAETNLTDYFYKKHGIKIYKKQIKLARGHNKKLFLGWNFITAEYLVQQFKKQNYKFSKNNHRDIDVSCRIGISKDEWLSYHRTSVLSKIRDLSSQYNIIATSKTLDRKDYFKELDNSKICFSPFGYGEVCWRDFEALLSGCLLIKPSMEHLTTMPDIFIKNQTYVPVKWDLSDLKEKCIYYLTHKKEREKIIKNAEKEYITYFKEKKFVDRIGEMLIKLNLLK